MAAALCRKRPSPLASGQPRTWACGIVYVLGQINFLTDPSTQPFMTTADANGAVLQSRLESAYRGLLILTFGGGTNELQRDLIAMFGLGLPRSDR